MSFIHSAIAVAIISITYAQSENNIVKSSLNNGDAIHLPVKRELKIDPEAYMTTEEIIKYHGYPVNTYDVITDDGFVLMIHQIPHGKAGPGSKPGKPILLQHGLLVSAASWVLDTPAEKNLPFFLADNGYEVWLGNIRGTIYGKRHLVYSTKNKKFWEYSFDEMAKYDMPAIIDFMLTKIEYKQIYYVGHSMGTSMMFALLSTQPKYNDIVKTFFALAPVARLGDVKTPLKYISKFTDSVEWVLSMVTNGEFLSTSPLMKFIKSSVCHSSFSFLCENVLFLICGFNPPELNSTRVPVYLYHNPAGTSVQTLMHYAQLVQDGTQFKHYDHGARMNRQKYGTFLAPAYDLGKITTQVALYYGQNDYLVGPKDVEWLSTQLKNLVVKKRVPLTHFSHLDFLWAIHVRTLLYDELLEDMNELWTD